MQLSLFAAVYVDRQEMVLSIVDGIVDFDSGFFLPNVNLPRMCVIQGLGKGWGPRRAERSEGGEGPPSNNRNAFSAHRLAKR